LVTDIFGNKLEPTYPKRAKGLVKKGRAVFLEDNLICMKDSCPNLSLEDKTMSNINNIHEAANQTIPVRVNFNPREWTFHQMYKSIGGRSFITDFMGNLTEAYSLGNWHKQKTEIQSPQLALEKKYLPHILFLAKWWRK